MGVVKVDDMIVEVH